MRLFMIVASTVLCLAVLCLAGMVLYVVVQEARQRWQARCIERVVLQQRLARQRALSEQARWAAYVEAHRAQAAQAEREGDSWLAAVARLNAEGSDQIRRNLDPHRRD